MDKFNNRLGNVEVIELYWFSIFRPEQWESVWG